MQNRSAHGCVETADAEADAESLLITAMQFFYKLARVNMPELTQWCQKIGLLACIRATTSPQRKATYSIVTFVHLCRIFALNPNVFFFCLILLLIFIPLCCADKIVDNFIKTIFNEYASFNTDVIIISFQRSKNVRPPRQ